MCKEDVRIGRKKTAVQAMDDSVAATWTQAGKGNPNRAGWYLAARLDPTVAAPYYVVWRAGGQQGPIVAVLTVHNPAAFLSVEEWGDGVLQELWVIGVGTDGETVSATSIEWYQELAEL